MGDLSRNFSRSEFKCRHCGLLVGPHPGLVVVLQRIRDRVARPITIRSGYRCPTHNVAVGGAKYSRHVVGDAADIDQGIVDLSGAYAAGAVGVGTKNGWATHVDTRPGPRRHWTY